MYVGKLKGVYLITVLFFFLFKHFISYSSQQPVLACIISAQWHHIALLKRKRIFLPETI